MNAKYFYLLPFGFEKTVIESQVIVPLTKLKAQGMPSHLLVFEDLKTFFPWTYVRRKNEIRSKSGGLAVTIVPRCPRNFCFLNSIVIGFLISGSLLRSRSVFIHARGLQGAAWAVVLKKWFKALRVICDVRGIEPEEYAYDRERSGALKFHERWWKRRLEKLTKVALLHSDLRCCVSKALIEYLKKEYGVPETHPWLYLPCAVDVGVFSAALNDRAETRTALRLRDKLVVIYSGAFRRWQMPEASVTLFQIIKKAEPQAFFLCLTPDVDEFHDLFQKKGVNPFDVKIIKVAYGDIPRYLAAGDIGLLLREDSPVNRFSCPTKFSEYLASGLHVITTEAILDVAEVVRSESVGTLMPGGAGTGEISAGLQNALHVSRLELTRIDRSIAAAERLFDWDRYIPPLKKCYLQLQDSP